MPPSAGLMSCFYIWWINLNPILLVVKTTRWKIRQYWNIRTSYHPYESIRPATSCLQGPVRRIAKTLLQSGSSAPFITGDHDSEKSSDSELHIRKLYGDTFAARMRGGDWRNVYLTMDVALRIKPSQPQYRILQSVVKNRPVYEPYQVFFMICQAGGWIRGKEFRGLLDCIVRAQ